VDTACPPVLDLVIRYRNTIFDLRNFDWVSTAAAPNGATISRMTPRPTDEDYRRLLELRTGLRRFLRWSEQHAEAAGLTPAQHQLLLAIRGHGDPRGPTVGDVAGYLMLRHHSAVGLVDRAEKAGLITRGQDPGNLSVVRLRLTDRGARQLEALSEQHLDELAHLAPTMHALWDALEDTRHRVLDGAPHPASPPARGGG
jgi:DNA-binding MarR family transcriptional regulator